MSTHLTSKGQVTIPKNIRTLLNLKPGMAVDFILNKAHEVVLQVPTVKTVKTTSRFAKIRGIAKVNMSTDEIMALLRD